MRWRRAGMGGARAGAACAGWAVLGLLGACGSDAPTGPECSEAPSGTGALTWVAQIGGDGYDTAGPIAAGEDGGVLVAGSVERRIDCAPDDPECDVIRFYRDLYVRHLTVDGTAAWQAVFEGEAEMHVTDLAIAPDGDVVVVGYFTGAVSIGSEPLTADWFSSDVFVVRLSPDGRPRWARAFGGEEADFGIGVAIRSDGAIVVVGVYAGQVDFGGGPLESSEGAVFLLALDPQGQHGWSRSFADRTWYWAFDVAITEGTIAVAGTRRTDKFVAALEEDGEVRWTVRGPLPNAVDFDCGDVLLAAGDLGLAAFPVHDGVPLQSSTWLAPLYDVAAGPGDTIAVIGDGFVEKVRADGGRYWSRRIEGALNGRQVAVDAEGRVTAAGAFTGSAIFEDVTLTGLSDGYVVRYAP